MILRRCLSTSRALPITTAQFLSALQRTWELERSDSRDLALAISGGVDSMALAALFSQTASQHGKIVAFVVDHGARNESSVEADRVIHLLQQTLQIEAHKLTVRWPQETVPLQLPNFETAARKMRYCLLGEACKDRGIDRLVVGHHQDDQAETAFMRFARGAPIYALKAMTASSDIPDCVDLHGVYQSHPTSMTLDIKHHERDPRFWVPETESGGVKLLRPLLNFSKERLVATCEHYGVRWVEDHTNHDRLFTDRNAVRHIFQSFSLPKAISKTAMLEACDFAVAEQANVEADAEDMLRSTQLELDTRIGALAVITPNMRLFQQHRQPEWTPKRRSMARFMYLKRLVKAVTPTTVVSRSWLKNSVMALFPDSAHSEVDHLKHENSQHSFNCSGVLFQRVTDREWRLIRQVPVAQTVPSYNVTITKPADTQRPVLFDNRYWIKVRCKDIKSPLVIRFLREHDLSDIRGNLKESSIPKLRRFNKAWSTLDTPRLFARRIESGTVRQTLAKGTIRQTMPVIALADHAASDRKNQRSHSGGAGLKPGSVIALPSLGITLSESFNAEWKWLKGLEVDVRYKKIDLPGLGQGQWGGLRGDAGSKRRKAFDRMSGTKTI